MRNFKCFDESAFTSDLKNANWPTVNSGADPNDFWASWKNTFVDIIDKHAPRRTFKFRNKSSPWITHELKQQMYWRDQLKRRATKTKNVDD